MESSGWSLIQPFLCTGPDLGPSCSIYNKFSISLHHSSIHSALIYSFALPGAKFDPLPPLIASTIASTLSKIHLFPSSLANHLAPSSPSTSPFQLSSSNAFLNPKTCDKTCGPTPVCALKQATATTDVNTLPADAPVSRSGSDNSAP